MKEEKYEGPRSDHRLMVEVITKGKEVIISGHVNVQAWHPEEGTRVVVHSLVRDGQPLYQRVVNVSFVDGRLQEYISLSHIDLPEAGLHVYEVDLSIINVQGGAAYTGQPFFEKHLRVREL